jgi:hypothetical protein
MTFAELRSSHPTNAAAMMMHINQWPRIVLFGAADLGRAVEKCLLDRGRYIATFWDHRHAELPSNVTEPYSVGHPEDTLVILCVGNTIYQPSMVSDIEAHGYTCVLGDLVYQVLGCPLNEKTGVDAEACLRGPCRAIYCQKLSRIVRAQCPPKAKDPLFLHSATVVINQICSLSCKYCTSYLNQYLPKDRLNFPLVNVISDIKRFFGAVDGVGTITVMGGEPFLHPDLPKIIDAILEYGNVGVISISTNGIFNIPTSRWEGLRDRRVNVSFSNYLSSLTDAQKMVFEHNVETAVAFGVPHTVGNPGPMWMIPSTLNAETVSLDTLRERASVCKPVRCGQIKNGTFFPCDFIQSVHGLGLGDYPDSRVDLGVTNLRENLAHFLRKDYLQACERCKGQSESTSQAGEQGIVNLRGE